MEREVGNGVGVGVSPTSAYRRAPLNPIERWTECHVSPCGPVRESGSFADRVHRPSIDGQKLENSWPQSRRVTTGILPVGVYHTRHVRRLASCYLSVPVMETSAVRTMHVRNAVLPRVRLTRGPFRTESTRHRFAAARRLSFDYSYTRPTYTFALRYLYDANTRLLGNAGDVSTAPVSRSRSRAGRRSAAARPSGLVAGTRTADAPSRRSTICRSEPRSRAPGTRTGALNPYGGLRPDCVRG